MCVCVCLCVCICVCMYGVKLYVRVCILVLRLMSGGNTGGLMNSIQPLGKLSKNFSLTVH